MIIGELLWTIFLIGFGICVGWSVREYRAEKDAAAAHDYHMGLYGEPNLSYWFRERSQETDPYWLRMPLREYAAKKGFLRHGEMP